MKAYRRIFLSFFILIFIFSHGFAYALDSWPAPDFKLKTIKNDVVSLSSFRWSKPVVLIFWTTWCPFCVGQLKLLNDKYPQFLKDGIELLAINVGEPGVKVEKFVKARSLNLPFLLDEAGSIAESFKVMGVPTYYVISKQGYVVYADNAFPEEQIKKLISK